MQERQTKQKQIIYDALKTLDHPTATEVYMHVHKNFPSVSRATVFRVLGGFSTCGKALELRAAGNEVRYDYNVMPHYHARCRGCGRVADVTTAVPSGIEISAQPCGDFELEGYSLEFYGICGDCKIPT